MLSRAAPHRGRKPPTTPITTAKIRARANHAGESGEPEPDLRETLEVDDRNALEGQQRGQRDPRAPPTSASIHGFDQERSQTLRRLNPRARRCPLRRYGSRTAAYIVIIAPIMAPKLKIVVTTIPSVLMT